MIGEYWNRVESQLESLNDSLEQVREFIITGDTWSATQEVKNAQDYASAVYGTCESWHSDDDTDEIEQKIEDWRDVLDMLPDPKSLSAKDMQDLIDKVNEWKDSNGFSRNTYNNNHF